MMPTTTDDRPAAPAPPQGTPEERTLRAAALVFAASLLLHNGDHVRRGISAVTGEVIWTGAAGFVLATAAIVLVFARHRLAPAFATTVGFTIAFGVAVVHLLPRWSAFSDALPGGGLGAFTWVAVFAEIGGAQFFGFAGLTAWRRRSRSV